MSKRRLDSTDKPKRNLRRLQCDLTETEYGRLQWLEQATDSMSFTEVIRESLKLRETLVTIASPPPTGEGKIVYAEDPVTKERVRFLRF